MGPLANSRRVEAMQMFVDDAVGKGAKVRTGGKRIGDTGYFFDHPGSFRHPTPWHVRTYGLFTANPFGSKALDKTRPSVAFELAAGERLKLRHRFLFHTGDTKSAKIAEAYTAYAKEAR